MNSIAINADRVVTTETIADYLRSFGKQGADYTQVQRFFVSKTGAFGIGEIAVVRARLREIRDEMKASGTLRVSEIKARPGMTGMIWTLA